MSLSVVIIGLMIVTGFAALAQTLVSEEQAPDDSVQLPQAEALAGTREATYTIDHMFELYLKSHDPSDLGRWNGTMGINEWWPIRQETYLQFQARSEFPYVLVHDPSITWTSPTLETGNAITTWYRLTVDAKNLSSISSGPGLDPIFVPVLGPTDISGSFVNVSFYGTYLENWELASIGAGTHYANSYYGVPPLGVPHEYTDDGFFHELQGTLTFNRPAAGKFLGLTGAGSLVDQFTANDALITNAWHDDWEGEGGSGGAYDIYTAYDYPLDIRLLELSLDPASTPDNLVIRFWSVSWGNEILLVRYMEAADVLRYWQGWPDDWYLNISIRPDGGSVHSRAVMGYHMYATKDSLNNINGWALEATHIDLLGNSGPYTSYPSPFNLYDPLQTHATHTSWAPFTVNFGKPVSYYRAPSHWNLSAGEKLVVKLPTSNSLPGYFPQASTNDVGGPTKIAEMAGNVTWGQMVAGNGYPNSGSKNLKSFFSKATKTYTLVGPLDFSKNWNPSFPGLMETGAPMFVMNVVKSFSLNLVAGWNLVSLPLTGYGYRASTLGLSSGDVIVGVDYPYHVLVYKTYVVGNPFNDFAMLPNQGYWIFVSVSKTLTILGVVPNTVQTIQLPSGSGWWLIGFLGFKTWHASEIVQMFNGTTSLVVKFNPITKTYITYIAGLPINNFLVGPGEACWVYVEGSAVIRYRP